MKQALLGLLLVCVSPADGSASSDDDANAPRVLIDTDMAADDYVALLLALRSPAIRVEAVTICGTGEVHCGPGITYARGLLAVASHPSIPVACGGIAPTTGQHGFPPWKRELVDSGFGMSFPPGPPPEEGASTAVDLMVRQPGPYTLIALGPLTNLADALLSDPTLSSRITRVIAMGGALNTRGNVPRAGLEYPLAESNIFMDPHAANIVFNSGVPITLVPLDATRTVPLGAAFFDSLRQGAAPQSAAEFIWTLFRNNPRLSPARTYIFHDALAVAALLQPPIVQTHTVNVRVVEDDGPESGWVTQVRDGALIEAASAGHRDQFAELLLEVLLR